MGLGEVTFLYPSRHQMSAQFTICKISFKWVAKSVTFRWPGPAVLPRSWSELHAPCWLDQGVDPLASAL